MAFKNDIPMISGAIWHWMHCHSPLSYTKNRGKWQKLKQKNDSVGKIFPLLFFSVNVNVLKQISLQALWNILQPFKHLQRVVLGSIKISETHTGNHSDFIQ